jgi:type IV pilus assembly protein PilP
VPTTAHLTRAALAGLLGGLLAGGPVPAGAADGLPGPLGAIDKAEKAADTAGARAAATDEAARPLLEGKGLPPKDAAGTAPANAPADATAAAAAPDAEPYDAAAHRDPFKPPTIDAADGSPRTPLERYEIGQLRLVGVVWDASAPRAMVEDSAGLGYILTVNTPIGVSGGIVKSIEPRRVLIEEQIQNYYGEKVPKEVIMELPQEDSSP